MLQNSLDALIYRRLEARILGFKVDVWDRHVFSVGLLIRNHYVSSELVKTIVDRRNTVMTRWADNCRKTGQVELASIVFLFAKSGNPGV